MLSVRPSSSRYSLVNHRLYFCIHNRGKGDLGPLYQLRQVLAKGRQLLQILLKALHVILWQFSYYTRVGNCTFLVANATKKFALVTRISQLVADIFPFGDWKKKGQSPVGACLKKLISDPAYKWIRLIPLEMQNWQSIYSWKWVCSFDFPQYSANVERGIAAAAGTRLLCWWSG